MLAKRGRYDWLERTHHYIQFMFPKKDGGVAGAHAPLLTDEDIAVLVGDQSCTRRLLQAYELIIDFWGFERDGDAGLRRKPDSEERFENITAHDHNYLRITRVVRSLTLLRQRPLAVQLVEAFLDAVVDGSLPGAGNSCVTYWIPALGSCADAKRLRQKAEGAGLRAADSIYFNRGCRAALR
eukprot:TRINITY_DN4138_c1_g4_i1.p2 TRINITY_DN4138_c1_g4~~TRINITY_DN4138_c1_g4_i1.p2  ORF type:complete len:182 (+),score=53.95 TRINITY_DN4138_c1_g4_i1:407-952(+)